MNQTLKQLIGLLPALCFLVACQEDTFPDGARPGDDVLRLSGVNAQQVQIDTRADGVKGFFKENTHYRILMEGDADGNGAQQPNLRFSDVGHDVATGSEHFIQLLEKQGELIFQNEQDVVDFYGLTDPAIQKENDNSAEYKEFVANYLPVEDFQYKLMASEKDGKYTLPDLRSAVSTKNSLGQLSYVIPLHFKHILSKVNFEIVQQVDEENGGELFSDLTLEELSVAGQPTAGTFHLKKNCFTKLTGTEDYPVSLKEAATSIPITIAPQEVGSILLFPMTAPTLDETNMLKVKVTLGGSVETLRKFGQDVKDDDGDGKGSLTLTCPVYANNPAGEGTGTTPLRLLPNYEYDLQFVIMSNEVRIITIVPRVYEWLDGEKDNYGHHYEEQDLGQPITFNGVVWSDRNLGASSAHPLRSIDDWRKSVGYYYQFNRNIPYFPNDYENGKIDLKTDLAEALYDHRNNRRPLYPVVNFTAWGEDKYPEQKFIAPTSGNEDWYYISQIGKKGESNNCWSFLTINQARHKKGLWQNKETQPCPKGWRLPTYDDFKGILPGSAFSGNITFRMLLKHAENGGWRFVGENSDNEDAGNNDIQELDFPEMFKPGGRGMELRQTGLPGTLDWEGKEYKTGDGKEVAYLGEFPCLFRCEVDDPLPGRKSQYILSMHEEDWQPVMDKSNKYRDNGFIFNWGTIYAIKNQGTAQAYRIKWEVKLVGYYDVVPITETNPDIYQGKEAHVYDGFYGVLVISRYTANEYDKFEPDEKGSFVNMVAKEKWANPVEVMYLPICGVGGTWNDGELYNIGTETWYATSEYFETNNKKGMVWLKLLGDNKNNQGFFYEPMSPMCDLLNVRPVRDN